MERTTARAEAVGVARVAVAAATYSIDKPYDYLVPESLAEKVRPGVRVTVPFGAGNRTSEGVILAMTQESRREELKPLGAVLDDESVLGPEQLRLAMWLRERYFCTLYDGIKVLLPAGLWYRVREICTLAVDRETALEAGANDRESRVLEALAAHGGSAELETLRLACGEGAAGVVRELQRRGLVTVDTAAQRRLSDKTARRVALAVPAEEALAAVEPKRRSAPMRYEVVKLLCAMGSALSSDICYFTGCSPQTLRGLEKSALVSFSREEVLRVPRPAPAEGGPIRLSGEQQAAYEAVLERLDQGGASCTLLYGVTGSGKDDPGSGDRPHPPDDGQIQRLLWGEGGDAPQRPAAERALRPVEAHPAGRGGPGAGHPQRGVRAHGKPGDDYSGRGA